MKALALICFLFEPFAHAPTSAWPFTQARLYRLTGYEKDSHRVLFFIVTVAVYKFLTNKK